MNTLRWNSFDVLKGISCIAIIIIHCHFKGGELLSTVGTILNALSKFAVPIFFFYFWIFRIYNGGVELC